MFENIKSGIKELYPNIEYRDLVALAYTFQELPSFSQKKFLKEIDKRIKVEGNSIRYLDLGRLGIFYLPDALIFLPYLSELRICCNRISYLELRKLKYNRNLKKLNIAANKIENLYPIVEIPSIEEVDASYNHITSIPEEIISHPNIKAIYLYENKKCYEIAYSRVCETLKENSPIIEKMRKKGIKVIL